MEGDPGILLLVFWGGGGDDGVWRECGDLQEQEKDDIREVSGQIRGQERGMMVNWWSYCQCYRKNALFFPIKGW